MSTGKVYEQFVQQLQQALINSEEYLQLKNIAIERNKKIKDNAGCLREFDLYWEYELAGVTYKTIIECKDYASKVSVEKIDALLGKIRDIPDLKPVFATKTGYQSGAEQKARHNKVELLIVREQNETDWRDEDGIPYLKSIHLHFTANNSVEVLDFKPQIDGRWLAEQEDDKRSLPTEVSGFTNEIFINDLAESKRYSLQKFLSDLTIEYNETGRYGEYFHTYRFSNAYLETNGRELKMLSFDIRFKLAPPIEMPYVIDFSEQVVGIIEYLERGHKTAIFRDRVIKKWRE